MASEKQLLRLNLTATSFWCPSGAKIAVIGHQRSHIITGGFDAKLLETLRIGDTYP